MAGVVVVETVAVVTEGTISDVRLLVLSTSRLSKLSSSSLTRRNDIAFSNEIGTRARSVGKIEKYPRKSASS
jgi:hypothetical protein